MKYQQAMTKWGVCAAMIFGVGLMAQPNVRAEEPTSTPAQSTTDTAKKSAKKTARPRLDVVFTVDATSSMSDEIEVIKKEIWTIANRLMKGKPSPDIRFGLVFYKDNGDDFVVRSTPLTRDIDKIHTLLMSAPVSGGGDMPEHVGRGLHAAMDMEWDADPSVSRLVYLVGDAPSQNYDDEFKVTDAVKKAQEKQIVIHAIGCSGIGGGQQEFTRIASATDGSYQSLTYHAVVEREDGKKVSVVYYDGETYEADEVLSEKEWKKGAESLKKKNKLKRAGGTTRSRAAAAPKMNNMDDVAFEGVAKEASEKGVAY
jgi:Mg-chelatase subunit ChlD